MFDAKTMMVVVIAGTLGLAGAAEAQGRIRIVSIGDSLASGEGNPDVEAPQLLWDGSRDAVDNGWGDPTALGVIDGQDWVCDRSQQAGHKLTADLLGGARPDDDVQFTSVACSGAKIPDLISTSQFGGVIPQLDRVRALFPPTGTDSGIDVLLISVGINDVGFASMVETCMFDPNCTDNTEVGPSAPNTADAWLIDPSAAPALDGEPTIRAGKLRTRWDRLIAAIETKLPNVGMVIVHEYPDAMTDRFGSWCNGDTHFPIWTPFGTRWERVPLPDALIGISSSESQWASEHGIAPLNGAVRAAVVNADGSRWQYVDGISARFSGHGFCAGGASWINTIADSLRIQNEFAGAVHPNGNGHDAYAGPLRDRLQQIDWSLARATPSTPTATGYGATSGNGETLRLVTPTSALVPWDHGGAPAMFFQVAARRSTSTARPDDLGAVPWIVPGAPTAARPVVWSDSASGWTTTTRVGNGGSRSTTVALPSFGTWRVAVRACSLARCSPWSATVVLETAAPPTPTGFAQVGGSGTTIGVEWSSSSPLTRFHQLAWRPWTGGAWTYRTVAVPTSGVKINLGSAGRFDVFVRACANGACSSWTGLRTATALPPQPTHLTRWPTVGASLFGVQLAWTNPASQSGSTLQLAVRRTATLYSYGNLAYNATSLLVDWEENSWVRACNERGCTPWSARIGGPAEAPPAAAPTPPTSGPGSPPPG